LPHLFCVYIIMIAS